MGISHAESTAMERVEFLARDHDAAVIQARHWAAVEARLAEDLQAAFLALAALHDEAPAGVEPACAELQSAP